MSFTPAQRQKCWEIWFSDSNKGKCLNPQCGLTVYRNATRGSQFAWEASHIRASVRNGSNNPRRNCIILCDSCNRRMQQTHPRNFFYNELFRGR